MVPAGAGTALTNANRATTRALPILHKHAQRANQARKTLPEIDLKKHELGYNDVTL